MTIAVSALWVAVTVQGVLLFGLYYSNHRLLRAAMGDGSFMTGLLPGTEVPTLLVADATTGDSRLLPDICSESPSLIFVSASCGLCREVLEPVLDLPMMRARGRLLRWRPAGLRSLVDRLSCTFVHQARR